MEFKEIFVFFLNVLLIIVFFSALLSIFSYLGVLPFIVRVVGGAISKITGLPRVESFHAVNSVFFGSSEALIVIKNDLQHFNKNRMFIICCSAMSSVSASVTASYVMMLDAKIRTSSSSAKLILKLNCLFVINTS